MNANMKGFPSRINNDGYRFLDASGLQSHPFDIARFEARHYQVTPGSVLAGKWSAGVNSSGNCRVVRQCIQVQVTAGQGALQSTMYGDVDVVLEVLADVPEMDPASSVFVGAFIGSGTFAASAGVIHADTFNVASTWNGSPRDMWVPMSIKATFDPSDLSVAPTFDAIGAASDYFMDRSRLLFRLTRAMGPGSVVFNVATSVDGHFWRTVAGETSLDVTSPTVFGVMVKASGLCYGTARISGVKHILPGDEV